MATAFGIILKLAFFHEFFNFQKWLFLRLSHVSHMGHFFSFVLTLENEVQLGVVVHASNPSHRRLRQDDCELEPCLGNIVRKKKLQKGPGMYLSVTVPFALEFTLEHGGKVKFKVGANLLQMHTNQG